MKTFFIQVLAIVLAALPFCAATELGNAAPALKIAEWVKGTPVDLQAGKGKNIYVIEFWATWCGPCRASIPHLTELQHKFSDQGVVFVGVSSEKASAIRPFVQQMGAKMDYAVASDLNGETDRAYLGAFNVGGIPHAFVIDQKGLLAWHGHPSELNKVLEDMVSGKYDIETLKEEARIEQVMAEYFQSARSGNNARTQEAGNRIMRDAVGSANLMNEFAWRIMTEDGVPRRDLELAMRAARASYDFSEGKDAAILDTYARAFFETGKIADAVRFEKQALALCKDDGLRPELKETLERYLRSPAGRNNLGVTVR